MTTPRKCLTTLYQGTCSSWSTIVPRANQIRHFRHSIRTIWCHTVCRERKSRQVYPRVNTYGSTCHFNRQTRLAHRKLGIIQPPLVAKIFNNIPVSRVTLQRFRSREWLLRLSTTLEHRLRVTVDRKYKIPYSIYWYVWILKGISKPRSRKFGPLRALPEINIRDNNGFDITDLDKTPA